MLCMFAFHISGSVEGRALSRPILNHVSGPNFICIGAQKAGTGWLYEQLRAHPDFWMPPIKELHYFDRKTRTPRPGAENRFDEALSAARDSRDENFIREARQLFADREISPSGYAALFDNRGKLISGDITPGYSTLPDEIVSLVARSFPEAEIIFVARDPVERAWSQLSMWVRHGRIPRFDPNDADAVLQNLSNPGVLARSYPSEIVRRWKEHVAPGKLHTYFFDDLKAAPEKLRFAILSLLGADPAKGSGTLSPAHNAKGMLEKLPFTQKARETVAQFFREELERCARDLGGPATKWASRYPPS